MEIFKEVFGCKDGIKAMITVAAGIIFASVAGSLLRNTVYSDMAVILGSVTALIGTQTISRLVVAYRQQHEDDDEGDE